MWDSVKLLLRGGSTSHALPPFSSGSDEQRRRHVDMGLGAVDPMRGGGGCGIPASYGSARMMGSLSRARHSAKASLPRACLCRGLMWLALGKESLCQVPEI